MSADSLSVHHYYSFVVFSGELLEACTEALFLPQSALAISLQSWRRYNINNRQEYENKC